MKLRELIDALPSIRKISEQDLSMDTLYRVSKTMKELEKALDFYEEQRQEIFNEYCDEKDGKIEPKPGFEEIFEEQFSELLDLDVTDDLKPVEIPVNEKIRLSYSDLRSIEEIFIIKFPAEEQEEKAE